MGGGNGQNSKMAREKNTEMMKPASKRDHPESNKKSMTVQRTKEVIYQTKESVAIFGKGTAKCVYSHEIVKTVAKSSWEEVVKMETTGHRPNNTIGRRDVLEKRVLKLEKVKLQQSTTPREGTNGGVGRTAPGKLSEASSLKARERGGCMEKSRGGGKKASK